MADGNQPIIFQNGVTIQFEAKVKGVEEGVRGHVSFDLENTGDAFLRVTAGSYIPSAPESEDYGVTIGKFTGERDLGTILRTAHHAATTAAHHYGEVECVTIPAENLNI